MRAGAGATAPALPARLESDGDTTRKRKSYARVGALWIRRFGQLRRGEKKQCDGVGKNRALETGAEARWWECRCWDRMLV
jgi:hypothetical protein